jgi:hypothetical protein
VEVIVGNELACTVHHQGKCFSGKALLESGEIIFRGETRFKIAVSAITGLQAKDGELHVQMKEGAFIFVLGPQAAKWCEKIANPKSVLDKLGIKPGQTLSLVGTFPADFRKSLQEMSAGVSNEKDGEDSTCIFFAANKKQDLSRLPSLAKSIHRDSALWLVYPKGQAVITEADVRSSGRKAGLVDIKVVSFSATHTALKFVLPKSKR